MIETKKCTKCGEVKELGDFYEMKSWCKKCGYESNKLWRKRNKKRVSELNKIFQDRNKIKYKCIVAISRQKTKSKKNKHAQPSITADILVNSFTGKCYVCGIEESKYKGKLRVCFSNKDGKLLGWQCARCSNENALHEIESGNLVTSERIQL